MSFGHKALTKYQLGVESTNGTAVAAAEILLGQMGIVTHDIVRHSPEHDRGVLATNYEKPFPVANEVELEFEGELYHRLAVLIMNNAIRGNVTPSQPDDSNEPNHYLWVFEPSMTTPNTPNETNGVETYTIELGDNVQAYEVEYVYTVSVEISGAPDEPCMVNWTIRGRQVTETTFTGALSAPATGYFPFNMAQFYIDDSYAGIGGTEKAGMLKGFTWTFETMFTERKTADGNLYFTALDEDKKHVELELQYLRDSTNSEAEKAKFTADTPTTTYLRIALNSHTEMDSGQSNPPYIYLDGAFIYTEWDSPDDEDGTYVTTVTAQSIYDTTASKQFGVSIGTTMDALPS